MKKFYAIQLFIFITLSSCLSLDGRISQDQRTFNSETIEQQIIDISQIISNEKLKLMFQKCYPNTLDTTVEEAENGRYYIITGDIPAMWLRDSAAQVYPFIKFVNEDSNLRKLIRGVAQTHIDSINIDPYANAFLKKKSEKSEHENDITEMKPGVFERKWEIDSLCYSIRLISEYVSVSDDKELLGADFFSAAEKIILTFKEQQRKTDKGSYYFMRKYSDSLSNLPNEGWGLPVSGNGMICSGFRPSDDSTDYLYLIPSNLFAIKSLRQLAVLLGETELSQEAIELADEVEKAVFEHGIYNHPKFGQIFAYETDGLGNYNLMDDANVPSLISLPYLGLIEKDNEIYQNTRKFILSEENPWYFEGKAGRGIGSPHTGKNTIWPMSIIMQAFTAETADERKECLLLLINSDGGTGFMHESFNKNNSKRFSRSWFSWANTLFGALIIDTAENYPQLLQEI